MKKTLSKLLSIILVFSILFTMPVFTALAEENDCPVDYIDLTLHRPMYENVDGFVSETEDGESTFFYYSIEEYIKNAATINIFYNDGSSKSITYDDLEKDTDFSWSMDDYEEYQEYAPWQAGMEIEAYCDLYHKASETWIYYDFTITLEETPIESITVTATKDLIENASGAPEYDDYGIEFYKYDLLATEPEFTIKWKDTSKADTTVSHNEVKELFFVEPKFTSVQSSEAQWEVGGTYTATASLMGAECDFDVRVISSKVVDISAVATHNAILGLDNFETYDYEYEEYYNAFNADRFYPDVTLTFENGSTITYEYNTLNYETNYIYNIGAGSNQSYKTPWSTAGDYSFELMIYMSEDDGSFAPLTCEMPVKVVENPVSGISVKATQPAYTRDYDYLNKDGFMVDESEDGYKHYWDSGDPVVTVTYTDGTVKGPMGIDSLSYLYDGKYWAYSENIQSYENPWTLGKNKGFVEFMGHTCEYDIILAESYVKSIKILEAKTREHPDKGYLDENDNFIYYTDFGIKVEFTLWDDSKVIQTVNNNSSCDFGQITIKDNQSEQPWTKDGENPITVTLIDNYGTEFTTTGNVEIVDYIEYVYYHFLDQGVIINGYYGKATGVMKIPETIDDYTVYGVSSLYSEDGNEELVTGVVIPDSVVQISGHIFGYLPNLESLSLGSGVKEIPDNIFADNPKLSTVTVSAENKNYYSSQNAIFTKDKTRLVAIAPACTETIILPAECTDINVLYTYPTLYKNVKVGYETAGDYCVVENGVTYTKDKTTVLMCDKEKTGDIVLPDTVKDIAPNAFLGCDKITSVTIPNTVTNIAYAAFGDCTALKSVTLPTTLQSIGDFAFGYCTSLTEVNFPSELTSIGEAAFMGSGLKNVTVPDKVEEIGRNAFRESNVETAKIGKAVKSMPKAFYECVNLKSVNVPASMELYDSAFYGCTSLSSANLENGLGIISTYAFLDCSALTSVTIPDSVTDIEEKAFAWSGLKSITIPDSVVYMGEGVFLGCSELTTANISNELEEIGKFAFSGTGLKNINWGSKVEVVDSLAFADSALESVEIPNTVTSIMYAAFENNADLKNIKIPSSVDQIGSHAFDGTAWYKNQPKGVVYNGDILYRQKGDITQPTVINIKNGTRLISDAAFEHMEPEMDDPEWFHPDSYHNLSGITAINIPNSVTAIGNLAFAGLHGITEITLPDSLEKLGFLPFIECINLKTVNIGKATADFDILNFVEMPALEEIIADPKNPKYTTVDGVLYNKDMTTLIYCPEGKKGDLIVPKTVTTVKTLAFSYTQLDSITFENPNIDIAYYAFAPYSWHYNELDGNYGMYAPSTKPEREITIKGVENSTAENIAEHLGLPFEVITVVEESETGITVSETVMDAIPEGATLVATPVEPTEENTVVFDITLKQNGEAVQPNAPIMVTIPMPEGIDPALCKVYRIEEDGSKTNMNATVTEDFIYFTTDHFSLYVIESSFLPGDINGNGTVNLEDVVALSQIVAGWEGVTSVEAALDPNGDGEMNLTDVVHLSQFVAQWEGIILSEDAYSK